MCPRMGGYVPTDHASRHQDGGRDEISIADLSGTPAALTTHEADYGLHTKLVPKTSDEIVYNSATLQNDDELSFTIGANEIWWVFVILIHNSGTTPDVKIAWSVPSGASGFHHYSIVSNSYNVACTTAVNVPGQGADGISIGWAWIKNGATAGTAQLQWAQNTQDASDTKILTGSCLVATKIA